ncbi:MAG: nuclear transport factor 2 family protein [Sphingobium sp.]
MNGTLEERLLRVEDQLALQALLNDYQRFTDEGNPEGWANCWTKDAVLDRGDGSPPVIGRVELAQNVARSIALFKTRQHILSNPSFTIDGDAARGTCSLLYTGTTADAGPENYVQFGGSYRWTFRRTDEGWKIETREMQIDWQRPQPGKE